MSLKKCFLTFLAASSIVVSGAASAAIVTFTFTGTVTYGGTLATAGSQITGNFSYDDSTQPWDTTSVPATYTIPAQFVISAIVEGHTVIANNVVVQVWDNANNLLGNVTDMVDVYGGPVFVDGNYYTNGAFGFQLASQPGNTGALTGTALPSSFNVPAFDSTLSYGFLQRDGAEGGQLLQFSVDSIIAPLGCVSPKHPSNDKKDAKRTK